MSDLQKCRVCDVEKDFSLPKINIGTGYPNKEYPIFKWKYGNPKWNVGPAPDDLYDAWACRECYASLGPKLEEKIREADLNKIKIDTNISAPPKIIINQDPFNDVIIPQNDYWTRPISSLFPKQNKFK